MALKRTVGISERYINNLLGAGVFGYGLGSLRHGVLGKLTGQKKTHCSLNLPGGDGGTLVVVSQTARLSSDALEDVVHEGVHDAHGLGGDAGVGMDLLQDLIHVDGIAFLPCLSAFLASFCGGLGRGFLGSLLRGGLCWLGRDVFLSEDSN